MTPVQKPKQAGSLFSCKCELRDLVWVNLVSGPGVELLFRVRTRNVRFVQREASPLVRQVGIRVARRSNEPERKRPASVISIRIRANVMKLSEVEDPHREL